MIDCPPSPPPIPPSQSPILKTQTITISDITNSLRGTVANKEVPLVHTETKTIMYESAQVRGILGIAVRKTNKSLKPKPEPRTGLV